MTATLTRLQAQLTDEAKCPAIQVSNLQDPTRQFSVGATSDGSSRVGRVAARVCTSRVHQIP